MLKITVCTCASRPLMDKNRAAEVAITLQKNNCNVRTVSDLCRQAMQPSPEIKDVAESDYILACHPRAVRSLFDRIGMKTDATLLNLRHDEAAAIFAALHLPPHPATEAETGAEKERLLASTAGEETDAWYPVIDKTRCTECGRCHDFCLFNVYEMKNKQVQVARPQSCKHNCPACARMCPSRAIIFPKYGKSPINGGLTDEETLDPDEKDKLYHERLRLRLEQRKAGVPLTQNSSK